MSDGKVVKPRSFKEWVEWFETSDRTMFYDSISVSYETEIIRVSTIFTGIDLGIPTFDNVAPEAVLFQTRIFGGRYDDRCYGYDTLEKAEKGHNHIVSSIQSNSMLETRLCI
jgi:hypothetical protein